MFRLTVNDVCKEFTGKLETIKKGRENAVKDLAKKEASLQQKMANVMIKKESAHKEIGEANTAIKNINKLFGINV